MPTDALFQKYYFSVPGFQTGTQEFHRLIAEYARARDGILEIGSGPSNPTSDFLATLGAVTGVDVSEEVRGNRALTHAVTYDGSHLPFADSSFGLCASDYLLEHVADPAAHFREVARVLRDDGVYCFRTPNLWHYVALSARLLPHSMHLLLANRMRGLADGAHDPYETYYRSNTRRRLLRLARDASLLPDVARLVEKEPSYGRLHPALFYPMMWYERMVNRLNWMQAFRSNLFVVLRKSGRTS